MNSVSEGETREYIVRRMFAPGIPRYVKETHPLDGDLIYEGDFTEKEETFGLNEPVKVRHFIPVGEVTSSIYRRS